MLFGEVLCIKDMYDAGFECTEILFDPGMIGKNKDKCDYDGNYGVAQMTHDCIQRINLRNDIRKDMYHNIVVDGGTALLDGFEERLFNEMSAVMASSNFGHTRCKISVCDPQNSALTGGAILASLSTFASMWITKSEYDETGPSIVHKKCY